MSSSAHSTQPQVVVPGLSRFRVRVKLVGSGLRPYGWEIYDEHTEEIVRRSTDQFRTSAEAWVAGSAALEAAHGSKRSPLTD